MTDYYVPFFVAPESCWASGRSACGCRECCRLSPAARCSDSCRRYARLNVINRRHPMPVPMYTFCTSRTSEPGRDTTVEGSGPERRQNGQLHP